MRFASALWAAILVLICATISAPAQEIAAPAAGSLTTLQATFPNAYHAANGDIGDFQVKFSADPSGAISAAKLGVVSKVGTVQLASLCRRICATDPADGKSYCVWRCPHVPGTLAPPLAPPLGPPILLPTGSPVVLPSAGPVLDVAVEFDQTALPADLTDVKVRLIQDPAKIEMLSSKVLGLSKAADLE